MITLFLSACWLDETNNFESNPSATLRLTIKADSEDALKEMISSYAEQAGYKLRIARVHPENAQFSISFIRDDSMILAFNPFEIDEYRFTIHSQKNSDRETIYYSNILNRLVGEIGGTQSDRP